jgi:vacuolar-type H+-ATPase subunit E/Vma4
VLTAASGRVAYNNQVATRLAREQIRIRGLIQEALFGRE